jgi:hypothetical protein
MPAPVDIGHLIQADLEYFGGAMPEKTAICWRGYLAATLEWNVITPEQYDHLVGSIPPVHDDPAIAILKGRD